MFRLTVNVCIILPVVLSLTQDMIIPKTEQMSYRLPNDTKPLTYNITIQTWIDSGNNTFVGQVIIKILVLNDTNIITLHHRQLNITQVTIIGISNSTEVFVNGWDYNKITEFFSITTSVSLKSMELYFLDIQYNGILRAKDELGFYSSYYTNNAGETRYLALTQFQPTDARHGFPCYDEPALKANFTIRVIHAQSHLALSNMPAVLTTLNEDNETITTEFEETPLMSTYLIAFVITDFLFKNNLENVNDLPQRIFSEPNALDGTSLALNTTVRILEALENLLELNFTLPKIDHIAVPHFRTGAMENWGLITYNEQAIIWRDHLSTYGAKLIVVSYIAHELAHQWFGNLVSPKWWSYLWLNEGFAIFLSFYVTDMIYTDWNITNYMLTNNMQQIFEIDASNNTHPMTHYVERPSEIFNLFDKITYDKSSCVIRMFLHAFSEKTFFKSLRYYLKESAYKVITEFDLYKSMQRAVEEDNNVPNQYNLADIWTSWTQQVGFPVVYVMRNYANNTLTISQERYLTYPMETMSPLTYWIPINFATAQNPDFSSTIADDWLPSNVRYKIIEQSEKYSWDENDWILINKQQTGYYRVQYDRKNWNLITDELCSGDFMNIHALSRSQLIDDAFTFARSNRLSWDVPLNIMRYLEFENEYQPWLAATNHLKSLNRYFIGLENYEFYKKFIINITDHLFNFTGIEDIDDEPIITKYIRTKVIYWACSFGSIKCRELTNSRLKELINNNRTIHQNLKDVMFCAGIRNADEFDMKHFINRMYKDHEDRGYIMFALGCASDENILKELLTYTLDKDTPAVLRTRIINTIFDNSRLGYSMAVQFLIDNVNQTSFIFYDKYEIELTILDVGKYATDDISINQAEKLFKLLEKTEHLQPYIKKANDNILQNIQWAMLNRHNIDEWLSKNFG